MLITKSLTSIDLLLHNSNQNSELFEFKILTKYY